MWYAQTTYTKMMHSETIVEASFQMRVVSYESRFLQCEHQLNTRFVFYWAGLSKTTRAEGTRRPAVTHSDHMNKVRNVQFYH